MSIEWFRSWHGAPTDPKWLGIARRVSLPAGIVCAVAWALMDRASQADVRGSIEGYDAEALACFFGCEPEQVSAIVDAMQDKGMIAGGRFVAWEKRQPKREDNSTERVRAHRERTVTQGNAAKHKVTLDKEEDKDKERKKDIRTVAPATRPSDDQFEQFKKAYPKRKGSNPWRPAEKLFDAAIKSGCDPGKIIAALRAGVGFDRDKIGTEYIPQAVKWLRDRRWEDHTEPPDTVDIPGFYAAFCSPQLEAWLAHGKAIGKTYSRDRHGGWRFPTEWPPGYKQEAA